MCVFCIDVSYNEDVTVNFIGLKYSSIDFADMDADGDVDVILTGYSSNLTYKTKLYRNEGGGEFVEVGNTPFSNVIGSAVFVDVNNDLAPDVLLTGYDGSNRVTQLFQNNGFGEFTEITETPFVPIAGNIYISDVDNDSDEDIFMVGAADGFEKKALLYTNEGNFNFSLVSGTPFPGLIYESCAFADIDNDNDEDLLMTGLFDTDDFDTRLFTNNGDGIFTEVFDLPFDTVAYGSVAFEDVDNDNDLDVLITGITRKHFSDIGDVIAKLYLNDSEGNFIEHEESHFEGVEESSIAFADIDGDNDQDVLITGRKGNLQKSSSLYTNDGEGNFSKVTVGSSLTPVNESAVAFIDVDNDNDMDIIISGESGSYGSNQNITKLYINESSVGIRDIENSQSVKLFPNPSIQGEEVTINLNLTHTTSLKLDVYDISGRIVYSDFEPRKSDYKINTLDLNKGVYFVQVSNESGRLITKKMIVK